MEKLDNGTDGTFQRVAFSLAKIEVDTQVKSGECPPSQAEQDKRFRAVSAEYYMLMRYGGCWPAGRIMSNAGADEHKPKTSTINCTVSQTIPDDMDGILRTLHKAGMTLKYGCGIGYEFSTLRPKGAFVNGVGASTNGPLAFADVFDASCFTVASAGGRRGAQMLTFDVSHPDVIDVIMAKREDGRLRQFNISILITDEFVEAVKNDEMWVFKWDGKPFQDKKIKARELWAIIMKSTYDFADPGFILIDEVNRKNNLWFCENIRATNPCGEQPLPPNGSCLLGSVNLTYYVRDAFTPDARFDFDAFDRNVQVFAKMLDNVVEINGLPLEEQREEIARKRRHGMGYLGLGSAMIMMGIRYGTPESVQFTDRVTRALALNNFRTGVELAKKRGAAPVLDEEFVVTEEMVSKNPNLKSVVERGECKIGDKVAGRQLFVMSQYFDNWWRDDEAKTILLEVAKFGSRFTHGSSLAPTGTLALSFANNASNGIEPSFTHFYLRNVIKTGEKTKAQMPVYSFEYLLYRQKLALGLIDGTKRPEESIDDDKLIAELKQRPEWADTDLIDPFDHIKVQAAAQKWLDSSISKTINVPTDYPFEKFQDIYLSAYESKLKGCTTFRFNPEVHQGVLVKKEDLEKTRYEFTLDDGSTVVLKGSDMVEYDGHISSAANLFDALKEGFHGKL
jgi:ribonucleoside-diphosphate reductase alpha chain